MVKDNFDNLTRISAFDVPILLLHGRKDTTIPFVHSEKLAAAAAKADLVAFEEGGHNNLYMLGAEAAISGFIKKL
jgi:fermentation-respiration switch protein FrsA (DUF1100 family)